MKAAALSLAAALLVAACDSEKPAAPAAGVPTVETAAVEARDVELTYSAEAVVEAVRQSTVSAQIAGRIVELRFDAALCGKGVIVHRKRRRSAGARGRRTGAPGRGGAAQRARGYNARASSCPGFLARRRSTAPKVEYKAAQERVSALLAGAGQAATERGFATVVAPYSGIVSARHVELGEMATPGKPLMTGFDPGTLRVTATVPQAQVAAIQAGAKARIELPSVARWIEAASLTVIPAADPRTHTRVRISLPTKCAALPRHLCARAFRHGAKPALLVAAVIREAADGRACGSESIQLRQIRSRRARKGGGSAAGLPGGASPWFIKGMNRNGTSAHAGFFRTRGSCRCSRWSRSSSACPRCSHAREEEPQIDVTMANVLVPFPGASAKDVEALVATPAEQVLAQMSGVEHVFSVSRPGMAVLTVQFKVGVPRTEALVRLHDTIAANRDWVTPELGVGEPIVKPKGIDDVPIMTLTLWTADPQRGAFELERIAHSAEVELKRVPGTREVQTLGGPGRALRVLLDPDRLNAYGISALEVRRALELANVSAPSGSLVRDNRSITVETGSFLESAQDVAHIVLGVRNARPVFLSDVAEVVDGPEQPALCADRHGRAVPAVTLQITRSPAKRCAS
jgi:hypothetical protein